MIKKKSTPSKKKNPKLAKIRKAAGRLNAYIKRQPMAKGTLPLIHTTRAYSFDVIIEGDSLATKKCSIFNERLVYLFYGRPSYRAKDGNNGRLEYDWPIVLIFDPKKISNIRRVYPFDSGAFELRLYEEFFSKESKLGDFALDPTIQAARRTVGSFYQNNEEYYEGQSKKNVSIGLRQFEVQGVHELSRLPGSQSLSGKRDERSSTIEIQLAKSLSLKNSLLGVILPKPYLDDPEVIDALKRWAPKRIENYSTLHNTSGDVWVGQIYEIARRILQQLGYLK